MQIEGKDVNLAPGMAVTAEIKTGERRIISYLLSPLRKYRQDSLRERRLLMHSGHRQLVRPWSGIHATGQGTRYVCGLYRNGHAADFCPDSECLHSGGSVLGGSDVIATQ